MGRLGFSFSILLGCGSDLGDDFGSASGPQAQTSDDTSPALTTLTTTGDGADDGTSESSGSSGSSSSTGSALPPEPPDLPYLPPECPAALVLDDVFDPNQVYVLGTLTEDSGGREAAAHWSTPDHAVVGWASEASNFQLSIRPADGRMLYPDLLASALREFHCDVCPWEPGSSYPQAPEENDPIVAQCPEGDSGFFEFLLGPDGSVLSRCGGPWVDANGETRYVSGAGDLLHIGNDGWALAEAGIVSLLDGSLTAPIFPQFTQTIAVRSDPTGGFFVVSFGPDPVDLQHVSINGEVESLGVLPPIPRQYSGSDQAALDGCLALYQLGRDHNSGEDVILRRAVEDETRIVYTEADDPLVKLHISALMTGV